ncbi:hypothetical protein D3C84_1265800 [compost metagenome]
MLAHGHGRHPQLLRDPRRGLGAIALEQVEHAIPAGTGGLGILASNAHRGFPFYT